MERSDGWKIFLRCCCVSGILFGLAVPSFGWASETDSWKNLKFSVRIFSIPENFSLEQMSFSYNGLADRGTLSRPDKVKAVSPKRGLPLNPLTDFPEKPSKPTVLNNRIRKFGELLLQYINVGEPGYAKEEGDFGFLSPNGDRDQTISFEFESTPSNFSGAVLFTMNL